MWSPGNTIHTGTVIIESSHRGAWHSYIKNDNLQEIIIIIGLILLHIYTIYLFLYYFQQIIVHSRLRLKLYSTPRQIYKANIAYIPTFLNRYHYQFMFWESMYRNKFCCKFTGINNLQEDIKVLQFISPYHHVNIANWPHSKTPRHNHYTYQENIYNTHVSTPEQCTQKKNQLHWHHTQIACKCYISTVSIYKKYFF